MTNSWQITVPGRVNLIGEHIDYHNLPVLPMAIPRHIRLEFCSFPDANVRVESAGFGQCEVDLTGCLTPSPAGDWANYLKAAILAVQTKWSISTGFQGRITSNLPAAAGLSSSSALLTAFTLALLRANDVDATLGELMAVLPEGEHFVGTRGGGMDHAAVLASRAGHASWISFKPFGIEHVPVPHDWRFLVAHSMTRAEKSGAAKARYNSCRTAGISALAKFGLCSYQEALATPKLSPNPLLTPIEQMAFLHVTSEAARVSEAVNVLRTADREGFGRLLIDSHASLRDLLQVSCPALDRIVEMAVKAGADGARLTGAGFGGCAIILCNEMTEPKIIQALEKQFYAAHCDYKREEHLLAVTPSNGALYANT